MSHDMSIHVYGIGDKLSASDFQRYMVEWGCSPMQHVNPDPKRRKPGRDDGSTFTCMREVNGYTETWRATEVMDSGEIAELTRTA